MKLNDEILIDYIFNLLEEKELRKVKKDLSECSKSRERLHQLCNKFKQLDLLEDSNTSKKKPVLFCLAAAAAVIFSIFITSDTEVISDAVYETAGDTAEEYFEISNIDHFSTLPESYSLMSELSSPLLPEQEFKIPEARISPVYEEPLEKPLLITALNREKEKADSRPLEYYCTLKLTN